MDIALTAEGTYPHQFGGVSVWCDQLVRGLPDYDFELVAVVATGSEPVRWELPGNVTRLTTVPLWGAPAPSARGSRWLRPRSGPPVRELIDILLSPPEEGQERFGQVLRGLFEYAQQGNLSAALASEESVQLLSEAWRQRWPAGDIAPPTLQDAVVAIQLLEHALRPLAHPPPRADLVHAVTNGLGALPALAAKWRYGTPIVVTEHGIYMREHYLHSRQDPYRWPVKQLHLQFLRRLCALGYTESEVITPGNVYNQRWETQLGADMDRVRTVYNGVDPADFPALDSEPEVPTISWAGRIDPVKDLETLLRAFALVRQEIPAVRLRIFGSPPGGRGPYVIKCEALADELGVRSAVVFEGRVAQIRDAYAAGQIVVLSSISEGFPYTLIEAMTCGRACVSTDVGGVTEAVGDTGLVVPPRNPAELARACLTLLRDPALRQRLGSAARLRALEYFTVDRAISAFDEIYMFLGSGHPLPARQTVVPGAIAPAAVVPDAVVPDAVAPDAVGPAAGGPDAGGPETVVPGAVGPGTGRRLASVPDPDEESAAGLEAAG
jgi:glycosyltransferase involved in cell wall biosynthesis